MYVFDDQRRIYFVPVSYNGNILFEKQHQTSSQIYRFFNANSSEKWRKFVVKAPYKLRGGTLPFEFLSQGPSKIIKRQNHFPDYKIKKSFCESFSSLVTLTSNFVPPLRNFRSDKNSDACKNFCKLVSTHPFQLACKILSFIPTRKKNVPPSYVNNYRKCQ